MYLESVLAYYYALIVREIPVGSVKPHVRCGAVPVILDRPSTHTDTGPFVSFVLLNHQQLPLVASCSINTIIAGLLDHYKG